MQNAIFRNGRKTVNKKKPHITVGLYYYKKDGELFFLCLFHFSFQCCKYIITVT